MRIIWNLKPCPLCGTLPILKTRLFPSKRYKSKKETWAYMHCQCNDCVIPWQKPTYDKEGGEIVSAEINAKKAWRGKKFIKSKKI